MTRLLATLLLFLAPAWLCADPAYWQKEIEKLTAQDDAEPIAPGAILFVGSSSIRLWTTLHEDFPNVRTVNRGFGGSTIPDVIAYIPRIVLPYQPRQIVFYAGANDIANGDQPETVLKNYQSFVGQVRAALPEVPIDFIAIAPNPARWDQVERVKTANALVEAWTKTQHGLRFIDVFSAMLGANGMPRDGIYIADKLHMNRKGYELWTGIVGPYLSPEPAGGKNGG